MSDGLCCNPKMSIKTCERDIRARDGVMIIKILHRLKCCPPQWKRYLAAGPNKEELAEFLASKWQRHEYAGRLQGKTFFVTYKSTCTKLFREDGKTVLVTMFLN